MEQNNFFYGTLQKKKKTISAVQNTESQDSDSECHVFCKESVTMHYHRTSLRCSQL